MLLHKSLPFCTQRLAARDCLGLPKVAHYGTLFRARVQRAVLELAYHLGVLATLRTLALALSWHPRATGRGPTVRERRRWHAETDRRRDDLLHGTERIESN